MHTELAEGVAMNAPSQSSKNILPQDRGPDVKDLRGGQKMMFLKNHRDEILDFWQVNGDEATMIEYTLTPATLDSFLRKSGITIRNSIEVNRKSIRAKKRFLKVSCEKVRTEGETDYAKILNAACQAEANVTLALEKLKETDYAKMLDAARKAEANASIAMQRVKELEQLIINRNEPDNNRALMVAQIAKEGNMETRAKVNDLEAQYEEFVNLVANQLMNKFFIPLLRGMIKLPPEFEKKPDENVLSLAGLRVRQLETGRGNDD
jgi:hypothetical protein